MRGEVHHMNVTADGWPCCTCGSEFATWADLEGHCDDRQTKGEKR